MSDSGEAPPPADQPIAEPEATQEAVKEPAAVEETAQTEVAENGTPAASFAKPAGSESSSRRQNGRVRQHAVVEELQPTLRLRLLCPLGMAGGLIGKKGESIMKIRRDTNTQVAVEDYVAGSEDRVVTIIAERGQPGNESSSGEDALCSVFDRMCSLAQGGRRRERDDRAAAAAATAAATADSGAESGPDAVAEANGHVEEVGESEASSTLAVAEKPVVCSVRLLVDSSQIGYLVGKQGATIKNTTAQSGASIKILPKAELPPCACVTDEIVLVTGEMEQVKAALRILGAQQRRHPPRPTAPGTAGPLLLGQASHPDLSLYHGIYGGAGAMQHGHPGAMQFGGPALYAQGGLMHPVEVTFRLLVPVGKAGNIIGRSGEHIKRIRAETGARIKVHDPVGESEERLVSVTSMEEAMAPYCAAQDALIRCVISLTSDDPPNSVHRVRLLTTQASVGVVLGKKGHTVTQLRAESGAAIKVLPADGLQMDETTPDEVVQVEGNMQQCIAALRGVATLLRGWQIRRQAQAMPGVSQSSSPPPGGVIPQPVVLTPQHHGQAVLPPPPPGSPAMMAYGYGSPLPNGMLAAMGGGHASFRYSLNQLQVGAVIGRGGSHVMHIRQLTGARVQLPGDTDEKGDRKLEISGTPDQCQAAHHLVNSYLAMGRAPPAFPC